MLINHSTLSNEEPRRKQRGIKSKTLTRYALGRKPLNMPLGIFHALHGRRVHCNEHENNCE